MMVFIGYGHRYLAFAHPFLAWAREASYPLYILHQTVIVLIGYVVVQYPWTPWTKYVTVLLASMAVCLAIYEGCVRRFRGLRLAFGMKVEGRSVPSASPTPVEH